MFPVRDAFSHCGPKALGDRTRIVDFAREKQKVRSPCELWGRLLPPISMTNIDHAPGADERSAHDTGRPEGRPDRFMFSV
jgi:hypothetical protein